MDFEYSPKVKDLQQRVERVHGGARLSERGALPRRDRGQPPRRQRLGPDARDRGAEAEGAGRRGCGTCSCRSPSTARASPTSSTRRSARSWAARPSRPRPSTAPRPTPATWRCWCATAPRRRSSEWLDAAARGRDPLRLRDDRARRSPRPTRPTSSASIVRDGDDYVINGRKWWTSGAGDPRCKILIFMGKTDPQNPTGTTSSR